MNRAPNNQICFHVLLVMGSGCWQLLDKLCVVMGGVMHCGNYTAVSRIFLSVWL
jgi:hypothetical protein